MVSCREERGLMSLPLAFTLVAICGATFGTFLYFEAVKRAVRIQLEIDECAGRAALDLRDHQNRIESGNRRIRALRASIAGATALAPEALTALKASLKAEVAIQEGVLARWKYLAVSWSTMGAPCGKHRDRGLLPAPPWGRSPPDPIGERPLEWTGIGRKQLLIRMMHVPRRTTVRVRENENENRWMAEWLGPGSD
jgi:hypothetical protein